MSPAAIAGMAALMGGDGKQASGVGNRSIAGMDPRSYAGVIEGMTGPEAQQYLAGTPGQGSFANWANNLGLGRIFGRG
jgi:hypothetical protein